MSNSDRNGDLQANAMLQTALADRIIETIKQARPAATNINFLQLYTEVVEEGRRQVAHFRYTIDEPTVSGDLTSQIVEGQATLVSKDEGSTWEISAANTTTPSLNFQNGSKINAHDKDPNPGSGDDVGEENPHESKSEK